MRVCIFFCLMCWARSENKRPCLTFSQLTLKDAFRDLFNPQMKIFLIMYTRNNLNCAEPLLEQNNSLNVNFNTSKKTVWLIHGYRPLGSIPQWLQKFLRLLLTRDDINIVVVDWNRGATTLIYNRAVKNTRKVALSLSKCIQKLLKHGASLDNFHFIGISLGAHISGFVGKIFQGQLGRITGLDPAGPKFSGKPSNGRLHHSDAKFVDVIHSDTDGFGIKEPLGHIDFYPNGGSKQPGCPTSIFAGMKFIKCDHQRAVYLFMAALETNCNFISFPCHSYKDYKTGSCMDCDNFKKKSCPRLGYQAELWKDVLEERLNRSIRTTVFLDTTGIYPFCTYYFVLSIIVLDNTMKDGYITFKLLNQLGSVEEPMLYKVLSEARDRNAPDFNNSTQIAVLEQLFKLVQKAKKLKNTSIYKLQEIKILAQFLNDVVNISNIGLAYYHSSSQQCPTRQYSIRRLMLKSLTYPERPPLCKYDIVLKENEEVFLSPCTCTPEEI